MTRVLFINPNTRHLGTILTFYPPLGVLYISSVLREKGYDVKMVDADIDDIGPAEIRRIVSEYAPFVVGITMNALQSRSAFETADLIREEDDKIRIVVGGPHPSALRGDILRRCRSIDAVVYGEGEVTFLELVRAFEEGRSLNGIEGVCFRHGEEIVVNEPREPINDLDSLPRPALDLVAPIRRYPGPYPVGARPTMYVMASRGCPFRCTFCSNPVWGRRVRFRSADSVLSEVEWLREKFKVREVFFQDDTFNLNRDWFESICEGIIERGLNEKIVFKAPFRADEKLLDSEMLRLARRAGFWMIFYGVESGNQDILNSLKKNLTLEEIERAFKLTKRAGIKTYASFMIGNLGETRATVQDTIEFVKRIDPDYYGFAIATPYPGSEFYALAERQGYLEPGFEEYDLSKYVLKTERFAPGEVEELVDHAHASLEGHRRSRIYRLRRLLRGSDRRVQEDDYFPALRAPDDELLAREVVMGENDWDVLGPGWYAMENWPPKVRWTGKRATAYLKKKDENQLCMRVVTACDNLKFKLYTNNKVDAFVLRSDDWRTLRVPLREVEGNPLKVEIEVDETWIPDEMIKNGDRRELGVAVERIWLE